MVIYGNSSEHLKVDVIEISKFTQEHMTKFTWRCNLLNMHTFRLHFQMKPCVLLLLFLLMGILVDGWVDKGINFENFFSNFLVNIFV